MYARGNCDTSDLVQEAAIHVLRRLDKFEPRHVGAMQAYLRMSVINRIRDEIRRVGRRPESVELTVEPPSDVASPLEAVIREEAYERYRAAVDRHLRRLTRAGLIDPHTATEARRGALEAYAQAHPRSGQ